MKNKFLHSIWITAFLAGMTFSGNAQDVHLSQFFHNNLLLNPANTGNFDGDYRITGNYRNQWRELSIPLVTAMAAFEKKFYYYTHEIDAGIIIIDDSFSGFNLRTNKILLSGAYSRFIGDNLFRAGIQGGVVMRRTDFSQQSFPNQWKYEEGTFDLSTPNMENSLEDNVLYPDINFGVGWAREFSPKLSTSAGFAINHLNKPNDSFHGDRENLRWRYVGNIGVDWNAGKSFSLQPKILYMTTTKTVDFIAGSKFNINFGEKARKQVYAGAFYRTSFENPDAIIGLIGATFNEFNVGLSYDYNISGLSDNTSNKSSFEIAVIYTAQNSIPEKISIPCDRY